MGERASLSTSQMIAEKVDLNAVEAHIRMGCFDPHRGTVRRLVEELRARRAVVVRARKKSASRARL